MRLDRYFTRKRAVELSGDSMEACLKELLRSVVAHSGELAHSRSLLSGLMQRESTMTTYLGNGVALPHLRVKMRRRYVIAVGRSRAGIEHEGPKGKEKVHLVFLLLASEKADDYLKVLAAVARLVKDAAFVDGLVGAKDVGRIYELLQSGFGGMLEPGKKARHSSNNKLILSHVNRIAKGTGCDTVAIFGDTMQSGLSDFSEGFERFKTLLITRRAKDADFDGSSFNHVILVRSFSSGRMSQARSAFLVGLTRGIIGVEEKICCVAGIPNSEKFDSIVVVDMKEEFQSVLAEHKNFMPSDVSPEVLERVIGIAMELSVEGREGRAVGTLFVLGDSKKVEGMTKPLVLNPFYGYKEEDRNVLSPFMDETVKEFSGLDGAFIIRGDGVLLSAGSLIHAPDYYHNLPSGLGARHAAAAAISIATDCLSIVISSSTGQVTVFRNGVALPLIDKGISG